MCEGLFPERAVASPHDQAALNAHMWDVELEELREENARLRVALLSAKWAS